MKRANQQEVWDAIAKKWGQFRVHTPDDVKDFLQGCKGQVLDVGCGSGRNFLKKEGLAFTATDFSKGMLQFAERTAAKKEMKVNFIHAPSHALPFGDETFDHALLYAVIHCVDTPERRKSTVEELFRVLKKGGTAFISCWSGKGPRLQQHKQVKETQVPWTVDGVKYERYTYLFKEGELRQLLENAGFAIEKIWEDRNINVVVRKPS